MPLRYAISFLVAYIAFVACVRIWADFMRRESGGRGSDGASVDFPVVDGEGCLVVLAALALGLIGAGIFALVGGIPLLLEVAFEVAFAGVIVRRLSRKLTLGDWLGALMAKTWLHALVTLCALVTIAAVVQSNAPDAKTFASAVKSLMAKPSVQPGR